MRIWTWVGGILPLAIAVCAMLPADSYAASAADLPAIEAYGMLPTVDGAHLSPDGSMVAFLSSAQGRRCLIVHHLDDEKQKPNALCPGVFEVRWFAWKTNSRLLMGIYRSTPYLGRLITESHLIAMNIDGSGDKLLLEARQGRMINFNTDNVLDFLPDDPDHILMTVDTTSTMFPDVIKVDVNSGDIQTVVSSRDRIMRWYTDGKGQPRLGFGILGRKKSGFLYQDEGGSDFAEIEGADAIGESGFLPLGFSDKPGVIYVLSNHETGRNCIYLYDVKNKTVLDRYASEPDTDVESLIWSHGRAIGYSYSDDSHRQVFTDPAWQHDAEIIAKQLPDSRVLLVDRTQDGRRVLAYVSIGSLPPVYYVLVRTPGKQTQLSPVGETRPYLADEVVAPVKSVSYRARDGLEIHAYLTLPRAAAKGPIPFVVLPHGGPYARDYFGFDYIAQMIASRGYGVLQPNFRGSTGYGGAFLAAGFREWGRKMQDDITDGTKWLIDQKLADPSRICIVGWSYGGYAALMGAVREPTLYRCAASMAGITDLKHLQPGTGTVFSNIALPSLNGDKSLIAENSPAKNADKINIPILLAHGREDVNVSVQDSIEMEKALRDAGKHVDALYFDGDDHFLFREGDRVAFLRKLEVFLKDNLGPPVN
jgi:dipeptidyl aminopeptidase/acylaminoacyl peptidase